ncbi:MAG: RNA polymerase sporulation sigma factor SigK [Bacillota bacterium]
MLDLAWQFFKDLFFFAAYVNTNISFPEPLSPQEEAECLEKYAKGDETARCKLIEHNLRLVAYIAKKYTAAGRDADDVISIGTIGLIKAVSTYNKNKGTALATYAARCIENEILMSIRTEKKQQGEVSLHDPIGTDRDGNAVSLSDVLGSDPEQVQNDVEIRIASEQLRKIIAAALTDRERLVVELRYGIMGGRCMAQREIAKLLGISRSYVSRIEKKALNKLNREFDDADKGVKNRDDKIWPIGK